jgi:hypothetical protein
MRSCAKQAIQAALSEKVGLCLQHMTTFIAGFVLSFIKGWVRGGPRATARTALASRTTHHALDAPAAGFSHCFRLPLRPRPAALCFSVSTLRTCARLNDYRRPERCPAYVVFSIP